MVAPTDLLFLDDSAMGPSEDRMSAKDTVLASPVPGKSDKPAQVYGNIDHTSVGPQNFSIQTKSLLPKDCITDQKVVKKLNLQTKNFCK